MIRGTDAKYVIPKLPQSQILDENQTGVFSIFGFLVKSWTDKIDINSRNGCDIHMNLGLLFKLGKRNTATWQN